MSWIFEGRPASDLLQLIMKPDLIGRTMALATVNALNHRHALKMTEALGNTMLLDQVGIRSGVRVAMVGYFPPLVRLLEKKNVYLSVIDDAKGLGDKKTFYGKLDGWADVLLITATSIINNSTETILSHAGPNLKTVLLGPSTPMMSPTFILCRWGVATLARLTVNLTNPFSAGDEAIPMGISPLPGMDNSANRPE